MPLNSYAKLAQAGSGKRRRQMKEEAAQGRRQPHACDNRCRSRTRKPWRLYLARVRLASKAKLQGPPSVDTSYFIVAESGESSL